MGDTPSILRWVYNPMGPRPLWAFSLTTADFGDAKPGDTICMDVAMGNYRVEKKEAVKSMRGVKEDHREPRGGWADGNYLCQCGFCACQFFGDKRAVQCADCAYGQEATK